MKRNDDLGLLAHPDHFHDAIQIQDFQPERLRQFLRKMILIRLCEEKIGDKIAAKKIACPCHLAIGQEAVAVGLAENLRRDDHIFGTHRSHAQFLSVGGDPYRLFAEVLGRVDGASKGMGGSMHLFDREVGFTGSVPIVGGTVPLAVGAALSAKVQKKDFLGVCFFGDGATEEGVFHESMNLASALKLPVIFVCENNLFSSHLHIDLRQPSNSVARYADAHRINNIVLDGNDVVEVAKKTAPLIDEARANQTPVFIEAVTYRWRGHVGPSEDLDVGVKRGDDLPRWKKRDPIQRLVDGMTARSMLTDEDFRSLKEEIRKEVDETWDRAELSDFPDHSKLYDMVYAKERGDA